MKNSWPLEGEPLVIENDNPVTITNKFHELLMNKKEYEFYQKDIVTQQKLLDEKKKAFSAFIEEHKSNYQEYSKKKYLIKRVQFIRENILNQTERIEALKLSIDNVKGLIKEKKQKIKKLENIIPEYTEKNAKIRDEYIPNIKLLVDKIVYTNKSLYKQYLLEFSSIFFNKSLTKYISFPPFYNQDFIPETRIMRMNFYLTHEKKTSLFFGFIIYMLTVLSKKFNITLPYNVYYNGSISCIVVSKGAGFLKLYINQGPNNISSIGSEDMEKGTKYMQIMLDEVLNVLENKNLIKNKTKSKIIENINAHNLYTSFITFNNFLHNLIQEKKDNSNNI